MHNKTFFCGMVLALLFFVSFSPWRGEAAPRGALERERTPVSIFSRDAALQQPINPNPVRPQLPAQPDPVRPQLPAKPPANLDPVQPPPAELDQRSGPDSFRYASPTRGGRSGSVYVPVLPGAPAGDPASPDQNSSSPGQLPADPAPVQPPPAKEPETPAGLSSEETQAFALLNALRAENNLPPLKSHPGLTEAARLKAQDLVENNYFGHVSPVYGSIGQMLRSLGISYSNAAENLSKAGNIKQAHLQLVYSTQGHRQIMLSSNHSHVGIGVLPLKNAPGIIMVQLYIKD